MPTKILGEKNITRLKMYGAHVYVSIFIITALWDFVWRKMTEGKIVICLKEQFGTLFCPNEYRWVKAGTDFFQKRSTLAAMGIAGLTGLACLAVMDITNHTFSLNPLHASQVLVCFVAGWLVGIFTRYSPDPITVSLFKEFRASYYDTLGWWESSYSDGQSGVIVMFTYLLLSKLIR